MIRDSLLWKEILPNISKNLICPKNSTPEPLQISQEVHARWNSVNKRLAFVLHDTITFKIN